MKNNLITNNNCAIQLLLVFILLFSVFHVSYQHDELISDHAEHGQNCEYCSSTGSASTLPANALDLDLIPSSLIKNTLYSFVDQHAHWYRLPNPRAPPVLV